MGESSGLGSSGSEVQIGVVQAVPQSEVGGGCVVRNSAWTSVDKLGPLCGHVPLPALAQPSDCLGVVFQAADEG